jgi:hypothetical protein
MTVVRAPAVSAWRGVRMTIGGAGNRNLRRCGIGTQDQLGDGAGRPWSVRPLERRVSRQPKLRASGYRASLGQGISHPVSDREEQGDLPDPG